MEIISDVRKGLVGFVDIANVVSAEVASVVVSLVTGISVVVLAVSCTFVVVLTLGICVVVVMTLDTLYGVVTEKKTFLKLKHIKQINIVFWNGKIL